jgi:hypothetical protein
MINSIISTENGGQTLQSVVLKPAPVVRLALWKRASRKAIANEFS